jgi:hypothetical protein
MDHGARKHAPHSASVIHRRFACPGSYRREQMATPRPSSKYAEEGTRAHEVLEGMLRGEGAACEPEMMVHVQTVYDYVQDILARHPDAMMLIEQRFTIPSDADPGHVYGMADIIIYVPSTHTLYVIDLKYGMDPVEVEENTQLLFYGLGALLHTSEPIRDVVLVIAQPRAYHSKGPIREWHTTATRLCDFYLELEDVIARSLEPDAPLVPGEKQCKYCSASVSDTMVCPAREAKALAVAGAHFSGFQQVHAAALVPPAAMPLDKLAYVLAAAGDLTQWLEEVKRYAHDLALKGHHIPGHKLVRPDARRTFDDPPEIVAAELEAYFGLTIDQIMPRKLCGITEIDTLVKTVARESATTKQGKKAAVQAANEIVATMTTKSSPEGVYSLVREDDRRPAVNPAQVFTHVQQITEVKP